MLQNYFVYNGRARPSGTIIKMRLKNNVLKTESIKEMVFCNISGDNIYGCREIATKTIHFFSEENFFESLVDVTDQTHQSFKDAEAKKQMRIEKYNHMPTFKEQMEIDGLGLAWVWYILIMAVSVIFNGCIVIWIISSVIFFNYRKKKLREEGYKL